MLKTSCVDPVIGKPCYLWGRHVAQDVDLNLIRFWIGTCNSHHLGSCLPKPVREGTLENVIDIRAEMVVSAPTGCVYAALSYVWGTSSVSQLKLTSATQQRLKSRGGLSPLWNDILQTIRDSMLLCQYLDIP